MVCVLCGSRTDTPLAETCGECAKAILIRMGLVPPEGEQDS